MLTGEYLALDNALVLTLPTQYGQDLSVEKSTGSGNIKWISYTNEQQVWFEGDFRIHDGAINSISNTNDEIAYNLVCIFKAASALAPNKLSKQFDYKVTTILEFPQNWGLGSSSTLINNMAQWFSIDPFKLHFSVFNGSGYDIAAAKNNLPVTYLINNKKPLVEIVNFDPAYKEQLFFVHLNQKQSSYNEIKRYLRYKEVDQIKSAVKKVSTITQQIINAKTLDAFEKLLSKHENILSSVLGVPTIKERLFADYNAGVIKSLGAWGGDFILATGNAKTINYFKEKGYPTILRYTDMIL